MQQFLTDEIRPERSIYLPEVVGLTVHRYGFLKHSDVSVAPEKGIKFENGRLDLGGGAEIAIESLDIFNDGFICVCRDTTDADYVLEDVLKWGMDALKMRAPHTTFPREYSSWLVVDFEKPISSILAKFAELRQLIRESYQRTYKRNIDFELQRLAFAYDPLKGPQSANIGYTIDRRLGAPYEVNRFFCAAPLRTEDHVELLRNIEAILSG